MYILKFDAASWSFLGEMFIGVIIPLALLSQKSVRNNHEHLFTAMIMVVAGVAWNRANVFMVGYNPPYEFKSYVPAFGEFAVTIGLISTLILCYRFVVNYFPVFPTEIVEEARKAAAAR